MRIFILSLSVLFLISCGTNRAVYKSADFSEKSSRHQTIAILPVKIIQTGHRPKEVKEEDILKANEKWGYTFQESLHSYVVRETSRNRKGPIVSFQAPQKTNAILKEQGWDIAATYDQQPEELARLLDVDAVMITTLEHNRNFSDGVAYGMAAGRIVLGAFNKSHHMPGMNASDVNMNSYLYDARDSKLIWKTFRNGGTDLPGRVDGLVEYYSNWIAKKVPYRS
jgi:hypothetical protein